MIIIKIKNKNEYNGNISILLHKPWHYLIFFFFLQKLYVLNVLLIWGNRISFEDETELEK